MTQEAKPEDPDVTITLKLSTVNFINSSLDKNPLGASAMQVAGLIQNIMTQAQAALAPKAEPAPTEKVGKKGEVPPVALPIPGDDARN